MYVGYVSLEFCRLAMIPMGKSWMIEDVSSVCTAGSVKCHPTNAAHRDQTVAEVGVLRFGEMRGKRLRATPRRST
jgi:hypothetical protein